MLDIGDWYRIGDHNTTVEAIISPDEKWAAIATTDGKSYRLISLDQDLHEFKEFRTFSACRKYADSIRKKKG